MHYITITVINTCMNLVVYNPISAIELLNYSDSALSEYSLMSIIIMFLLFLLQRLVLTELEK